MCTSPNYGENSVLPENVYGRDWLFEVCTFETWVKHCRKECCTSICDSNYDFLCYFFTGWEHQMLKQEFGRHWEHGWSDSVSLYSHLINCNQGFSQDFEIGCPKWYFYVLLSVLCNNRVTSSYLFYSKFWNFRVSKIRILGCSKDKWMGL